MDPGRGTNSRRERADVQCEDQKIHLLHLAGEGQRDRGEMAQGHAQQSTPHKAAWTILTQSACRNLLQNPRSQILHPRVPRVTQEPGERLLTALH